MMANTQNDILELLPTSAGLTTIPQKQAYIANLLQQYMLAGGLQNHNLLNRIERAFITFYVRLSRKEIKTLQYHLTLFEHTINQHRPSPQETLSNIRRGNKSNSSCLLDRFIAMRLVDFRRTAQMTPETVARQINVVPAHYALMETGELRITCRKLIALSALLRVEPCSFYPEDNQPINNEEPVLCLDGVPELLRMFNTLKSADQREELLAFARHLAGFE